jgi:hypothetical protein
MISLEAADWRSYHRHIIIAGKTLSGGGATKCESVAS